MRLITRERLADGPGIAVPGSGYRWIALSNTTLGTLMATINGSIILIALPDIFRGIGVNPLLPGNASLLLWLILGYLLVTAVLVVTFGRLGDMFGRVRIYTLGFAVFTVFSILLGVTWLHGTAGALWLIAMRILQVVGGAMLLANAAAILTDAFPAEHRGMALGLNQVAGIPGQFVGLLLGGLLGPVEWHLVFLVSVPFGVFGTFWAYRKLHELGEHRPVHLDWWGNLTFGAGLTAAAGRDHLQHPALRRTHHGLDQSLGDHRDRRGNRDARGILRPGGPGGPPDVQHEPVPDPGLLRRQPGQHAGRARPWRPHVHPDHLATRHLPAPARLQLQPDPAVGRDRLLPLTIGFLAAGPVSGALSDRFGARAFTTGGMIITAVSFLLLDLLPVNFAYWQFALILLLAGVGQGLFGAPNRAAIMNSLPAERRGAGSGMTATFQNSATVLSIGIFFTLIILGLAARLPTALSHGLTAQGVPPASAARLTGLPPASVLFAALLGYNPVKHPARPGPRPSARRPRRLPDRAPLLPLGHRPGVRPRPGRRLRLRHRRMPGRRRRLTAPGQNIRARRPPDCPRQAHDGESRQQPPARSSPPLTHARLQQAGAPPLQAWVTPRIPRLHAQHRPVDYTRTVPRQPSLTCCHAGPDGRKRLPVCAEPSWAHRVQCDSIPSRAIVCRRR